ncbi:MAG TPA: 30S ribosomal protein S12 methylthiotransferase RimO [Planctomycetes bacterium]|nr:30S ribosomal protein S12 methylthiotransferase RimO [Planctomycetota bacterium]
MSAPVTVTLVHLGCARNLIDSELILARMAEEGCRVAGDLEGADVAVLNTCSFIGPARKESEEAIDSLLERKRRGALRAVVVAGCLVQRFQHDLEERFPEVDLFAEISDYRELARSVRELGAGARVPRYLAASGLREPGGEGARLLATPGSYAYLRISHGCDHACTFCAIPSIRGPHRSKSVAVLEEEARELIDAGVRELVLVAEDSTAWGRDLGLELPHLVEALADLPGDHRLRVMYAYPNRFPWALTALLRDHERVLPYLDIPVQHAATPVLRAMGRAGSGDQVRRTLDRLREEVPGITLRTTLLVGFPGETDADVEELVSFVRTYGLGRMGVFAYSNEEGTPAFELGGAVSETDAAERVAAVLAERDRVITASQEARVDEEIEVLVDEVHTAGEGARRLVGRTDRDAPEVDPLVVVSGERASGVQVGERIQVRVHGAAGAEDGFALFAE